jgi:hypothetical protein
MLHAYDQRFDVTGNLKNFCELKKTLWVMEIPGESNLGFGLI